METSAASHSPPKATAAASSTGAQSLAMQHNNSSAPSGSQLRSRITVVCAECKRLKLKCDRRTPCGSCTKRDCIEKCVYSPAAAEKIDVQSLHNRLLVLEAQFSQVLTGRLPIPHSISSSSSLPSYNDRALLAVGNSGSSVVISLEDVAGLWLEELEINAEGFAHHSPPSTSESQQTQAGAHSPAHHQIHVKLEPTPPTLPALATTSTSSSMSSILLSLPPYQSYFRPPSPAPPSDTPSTHDQLPTVTPAIFAHLPAHPRVRDILLDKCEHLLRLHPSFNWFHFKRRVRGLFDISLSTGMDKASAREILFGTGPDSPSASKGRAPPVEPPKPTLSFFAAVAAAFALGALVWKEEGFEGLEAILQPREMVLDPEVTDGPSYKDGRRRKTKGAKMAASAGATSGSGSGKDAVRAPDPAALYALSKQALRVFEMFHTHDLDFLVTMNLQLLFLLHDGIPNISSVVFPTVGKMVNVARAMGLAMDPDEFPSRYSIFEAETRRRIWWDVFYYDLFVSDCMGHPPLIADNSHTTKIPVSDVDEERFVPESIEIPTSKEEEHGDWNINSSTYLVLKCRLAQLVKSVKKRSFRDPLADASTPTTALEQVAGFEAEVAAWLKATPRAYHMDMSAEAGENSVSSPLSPGSASTIPGESPYLVAQRCELSIIAHRLLLKTAIPFLRSRVHGDASARSPQWHQASTGTVNAAHNIVQACRSLHSVWRQNKRPAAFVFYSFGRTLFDAAICLAHAVIQQPTAIWTRAAMDDVRLALEILKDPKIASGRGPVSGGVEGSVGEAVAIVDKMFRKAQQAVKSYSAESGVHVGVKRKHEDVDVDHSLMPGFHLPYVGAGVHVSNSIPPPDPIPPLAAPAHPRPSSSSSSRRRGSNALPPTVPTSKTSTPDPDCDDRKSGKSGKSGKTRHPSIGIRIRGSKEGPPFNKPRHDNRSPSSSPEELVVKPYSPPVPHITTFELEPIQETGYTPQTPICVDGTEDKDFDMSFGGGNAEMRMNSIDKMPNTAGKQGVADGYSNGMPAPPVFDAMAGSSYASFASSPTYANEAPNHNSSGRSEQQTYSSAPVHAYPSAPPSFPPGSSHGAPQHPSPSTYSSPVNAPGSYNPLAPQNPYPPTPSSIYSSDAGPASYSHDGLPPHHIRMMTSPMDTRHMGLGPPMGPSMAQPGHMQGDMMRPPPLPSYNMHATKGVHNGPPHYMDGHGSGHIPHQPQPMNAAQGWPSDSEMSTPSEYWSQSYDMKLSSYS